MTIADPAPTTSTRDGSVTVEFESFAGSHRHPDLAVTTGGLLRAEWIKLVSVRSTIVTFTTAVVLAVGLGVIFSSSAGSRGPREAIDSASLSLAGFHLAELVIGVLGVVIVTSEYSSGLIRTTLAAVRSRTSLLLAKSTVFATTALVLTMVASFAAFFIGKAVYRGATPAIGLSDPGALRLVIATSLYCVAVGLFGTALGFIVRSTAGAIGFLVGGLFILPGLAGLLPWQWSKSMTKLLPGSAGDAVTTLQTSTDMLSPGRAGLVLLVWVVGLLIAADYVLRHRDA